MSHLSHHDHLAPVDTFHRAPRRKVEGVGTDKWPGCPGSPAEADGNRLALWQGGITVAPGPFMVTATLWGPRDEC